MGAGSLGTIIGAYLARAGLPVQLIDTNRAHVEHLNEHGAAVEGFDRFCVPVAACTPEQLEGSYDLVFLLTKQTYTEAAVKSLLPHLHETSTICTLQNGVPEEAVARLTGRERVVGGTVGFGATWVSPGVSRLTTPRETLAKYAFEIGETDGADTPRIHGIQRMLSHVGSCQIVSNLLSIRWSKLLINATFSGMSAALGCTFGDVLQDKRAMAYVARIADETIHVAHAQDILLAPMQGAELEELALREGQTVMDKMTIYRHVFGPHAKLRASMLQDLEKGLPTEIDFINGIISLKGKALGIGTPVNDHVVQLVKKAERNGIRPVFEENLATFP